MTVYVEHHVNVFVADDAAGADPLFGRADPTRSKLVHAGFALLSSGKMSVAASGTENVPLGDVTVRGGFYLNVAGTGGANIIYNSGSDTHQVRPGTSAAATPTARVLMDVDNLTQIAITNPSATAAIEVTYCIWGTAS